MPKPLQGDNWLANYVPYLLYRITNRLNRRLRSRLRKTGINITRWRVLAVLQDHGKLTLGEIVELTAMEQPSISRLVAQLEREKLVNRRVSKKDSRFVLVKLTAAGVRTFENVYPAAKAHQRKALEGFSNLEINALRSYLHRIHKNIESEH